MTELTTRAEFSFFHRLRVRWAEVDAQGIVFNPHYLMFADVAWTEYMRHAGYAYPAGLAELDVDLFAVHAELDFKAPAMYDDELAIGVRTHQVGRTSLRIGVAIFRAEQLLCQIGLVYVTALRSDRTPVAVPKPFVDRLSALEQHPPQRKN